MTRQIYYQQNAWYINLYQWISNVVRVLYSIFCINISSCKWWLITNLYTFMPNIVLRRHCLYILNHDHKRQLTISNSAYVPFISLLFIFFCLFRTSPNQRMSIHFSFALLCQSHLSLSGLQFSRHISDTCSYIGHPQRSAAVMWAVALPL